MSQDVVPAREVAAPVAAPQLLDTQLIRNRLGEAAAELGQANYSPSALHLLRQAWAVATHKRNRQVTIHHLAYALVFEYPDTGRDLAAHLQSDVDRFAVGCILVSLSLGAPADDPGVLGPAVATKRWLSEAIALARERGEGGEVLPSDLVQVVLQDRLSNRDAPLLRRAASVGNSRYEVVVGTRPVPSIEAAQPSPDAIITHMQEIEKAGSGLVAIVMKQLEDFEERIGKDLDGQKRALDRLTSELPQPPSGPRLAAAILAVLTLGVAAGAALTLWQSGSGAPQTVSAAQTKP